MGIGLGAIARMKAISNRIKDMSERMALLHDYKAHIKGVQRDRMLEATLQGENIFMGSKPILFVQTDGVDQSKWACPRLSLRSSKQQAKYIRSLSSNSPDNAGQCCFVPLGHG